MNIPFSQSIYKLLELAQKEAKQCNATQVDAVHIFTALLQIEDQLLIKLLAELKISKIEIINGLQQSTINNQQSAISNTLELPYSAETKPYFDIARAISKEMKDTAISPIHLFLAFLKDDNPESLISPIVKKFDLSYSKAKTALAKVLSEQGSKTPYLDKFGNDLTQKALLGLLDPVVGCFEEIERTMQILARRRKNNPLIYGPPGVGKTAIVEGIAERIIKNEVPEKIQNKKIIELSLNSVLAGASKRGEYEERLEKILQEIKDSQGQIILFIDEIHTIVQNEGQGDAGNILKPALARGEIQTIGATTTSEYSQYFSKNKALERRFQPVLVNEPDADKCFFILKGIKKTYETFHNIQIPDQLLEKSIQLSTRYITNRYLPDKAIDLIDEACAVQKSPSICDSGVLETLENNLALHKQKLEEAKKGNNTLATTEAQKKIASLQKTIEELKKPKQITEASNTLQEDIIRQVVCRMSRLPDAFLCQTEDDRLTKTDEFLKSKIIGQETAIQKISDAIIRSQSGLKKKDRPIGSFIFLGPTGVGKTELAETLALHLFGSKDALVRFDMSEFSEKHASAKLIGAPPGYIGYEQGGQLTEQIKNRPYSVILFDEIEKADPEIFNLLLQILDEGHLTDNQGNHINFKNTIIICTSNIGQETLLEKLKTLSSQNERKKAIIEELKKFLRLELINRFDELIQFNALTEIDLLKVTDLMLKDTKENLSEKSINLEVTENAKKLLVQLGYDPLLGARPLKYTIQQKIDTPLAYAIINHQINSGDTIVCDLENEKFVFKHMGYIHP